MRWDASLSFLRRRLLLSTRKTSSRLRRGKAFIGVKCVSSRMHALGDDIAIMMFVVPYVSLRSLCWSFGPNSSELFTYYHVLFLHCSALTLIVPSTHPDVLCTTSHSIFSLHALDHLLTCIGFLVVVAQPCTYLSRTMYVAANTPHTPPL
jgi:hypothetical protein